MIDCVMVAFEVLANTFVGRKLVRKDRCGLIDVLADCALQGLGIDARYRSRTDATTTLYKGDNRGHACAATLSAFFTALTRSSADVGLVNDHVALQ